MKKLLSLIVLSLVMMTGLAWAQGSVNFSESAWGLTNSFSAKIVEIDGVTWQYADARNQGDYAIDGNGIMLRKASESFLQATITDGIGVFSFQYRKGETGANARQLELIVNDKQVAKTDEFGGSSGVDATIYNFSYNVNTEGPVTIKIKNVGTATANRHAVIDNIVWTSYGTASNDPILTVNPLALSNFSYTEGEGPSNDQSFTVEGSKLIGDITLAVDSNYELSLNQSGTYTTQLILEASSGTVPNTTVYVRMVTGLDAGDYTGNVTLSSTNADAKNVALGGVVNELLPEGYFVNFEDKSTGTSYEYKEVELSGKLWGMTQAVIGDTANDWKNGLKSARFSGKVASVLTMLQDKADGLGTLSFWYRGYSNDKQVDWKVEYSRDQGNSWTKIGDDFTAVQSADPVKFSGIVNVPGNVRIRIIRASNTGTNQNDRRLNVDDILLTSFYDYNTGIENTVDGLGKVTFTTGNANNSGTALPPIPNTSISDYKSLALDLVGSGPWTIEIMSTLDYCAYNWQNNWYDAQTITDGFKISIDSLTKGAKDLFIVLSKQNPTLPVELSSFLVTLNSSGKPVITWETQTETGVNGFYIYRGVSKNITEAALISNLVPATNSSLAHSYSFVDKDLIEDGTYYYWLNVSDLNGHESYYGPAELNYAFTESEETTPEVTYNTALKSIYPNPFNPSANIGFELAEAGEVNISVYNTRGQLVRSFAPFTHEMGQGSIVWDGKDNSGNSTSSGIYLFRMTVGAKSYSAKALMLK